MGGTKTETKRGTGAETLSAMVLEMADHDGTALRFRGEDGEYTDLSYADTVQAAREIAGGLIDLGVEAGDRVAIFSDTRMEWTLADLGVVLAGAVAVPIYQTASKEEAEHVLNDSGASAVFAENPDRLEVAQEAASDLDVEHWILFEGEADGATSLADLRERGSDRAGDEVEERARQASPDDLFSLVYTSGTTGPPKGCILTHGNICSNARMLTEMTEWSDDAVIYVFLPLAHVLSRITQIVTLDIGAVLAFWSGDQDKALDDLREIAPTHFPAVPRIFEKIWEQAKSKAGGGPKEKLFEKAIDVGRQVRELERKGEEPGPVLKKEYELADKQVLSGVRDLFGGNLEFALTGAAPVAPEMLEFFDACGVLILEGYGATETSAVATVNSPDDFKFGTVGKAIPGSEVKIADDTDDEGRGEILVKGPHVFGGYRNLQEETDEVLDGEWFHTEDLGSMDEDGFLKVTGRLKEIIVTSSGKNITPTEIENHITNAQGVSNAIVVGDDRKFLVALVEIDDDDPDPEDSDAQDTAKTAIEEANEKVARIEQVKKWAILPRRLSEEEGELTPTMKLKREKVEENWSELIDSLYDEDDD